MNPILLGTIVGAGLGLVFAPSLIRKPDPRVYRRPNAPAGALGGVSRTLQIGPADRPDMPLCDAPLEPLSYGIFDGVCVDAATLAAHAERQEAANRRLWLLFGGFIAAGAVGGYLYDR